MATTSLPSATGWHPRRLYRARISDTRETKFQTDQWHLSNERSGLERLQGNWRTPLAERAEPLLSCWSMWYQCSYEDNHEPLTPFHPITPLSRTAGGEKSEDEHYSSSSPSISMNNSTPSKPESVFQLPLKHENTAQRHTDCQEVHKLLIPNINPLPIIIGSHQATQLEVLLKAQAQVCRSWRLRAETRSFLPHNKQEDYLSASASILFVCLDCRSCAHFYSLQVW